MSTGTDEEISRFGIQFGNDLDSQEPKSFISGSLSLSTKSAQSQVEFLTSKAGSDIDTENSIILVLTAETAAAQGRIVEILNEYSPEGDSLNNPSVLSLFGLFKSKAKLPFKAKAVGDRKVYISFAFGSSSHDIMNAISMLSSNGLDELANTQDNSIEISFKTNNEFDTIKEFIDNGETIFSSFLQSAKLEIILKLNKDFGMKLSEVVSQIDEDFGNSPPLMLAKLFKSIDIDFRFGSTAELPLNVREVFIDPTKKFTELLSHLSEQMKNEGLEKEFSDLLESEIEAYVTLKDLIAFKMVAVGPKLGSFFK